MSSVLVLVSAVLLGMLTVFWVAGTVIMLVQRKAAAAALAMATLAAFVMSWAWVVEQW